MEQEPFEYEFQFLEPNLERRVTRTFIEIEPNRTHTEAQIAACLAERDQVNWPLFTSLVQMLQRRIHWLDLRQGEISQYEARVRQQAVQSPVRNRIRVNITAAQATLVAAHNTIETLSNTLNELSELPGILDQKFSILLTTTSRMVGGVFNSKLTFFRLEQSRVRLEYERDTTAFNDSITNPEHKVRMPKHYTFPGGNTPQEISYEIDSGIVEIQQCHKMMNSKLNNLKRRLSEYRQHEWAERNFASLDTVLGNMRNRFMQIEEIVSVLNKPEVDALRLIAALEIVFETKMDTIVWYFIFVRIEIEIEQMGQVTPPAESRLVAAFRDLLKSRSPMLYSDAVKSKTGPAPLSIVPEPQPSIPRSRQGRMPQRLRSKRSMERQIADEELEEQYPPPPPQY